MNKTMIMLSFGILLVLSLSFALAEKPADVGIVKNADGNGTAKNMTFGQCVTEAVKIKNACFEAAQTKRQSCMNETNADNAKCRNDYKKEKKQCKADFKSAKKACIQTTKPRLWERMRYSMA